MALIIPRSQQAPDDFSGHLGEQLLYKVKPIGPSLLVSKDEKKDDIVSRRDVGFSFSKIDDFTGPLRTSLEPLEFEGIDNLNKKENIFKPMIA